MASLKFYPTLTDELRYNAGINIEKYIFSYLYGGEEYGLKQKGKHMYLFKSVLSGMSHD